jgi:hypothetical protein
VLYSKKNLEFLLEPEDTVHHYEAIGLQEGNEQNLDINDDKSTVAI